MPLLRRGRETLHVQHRSPSGKCASHSNVRAHRTRVLRLWVKLLHTTGDIGLPCELSASVALIAI